MVTNLLHPDQADLQQYIEENCLALCASSPSETTEQRKWKSYYHFVILCQKTQQQQAETLYMNINVFKMSTINWENLGVGHVSVDSISSFICRMLNECQDMLLCCAVSQAASISLWFIQVTEITEVTGSLY